MLELKIVNFIYFHFISHFYFIFHLNLILDLELGISVTSYITITKLLYNMILYHIFIMCYIEEYRRF